MMIPPRASSTAPRLLPVTSGCARRPTAGPPPTRTRHLARPNGGSRTADESSSDALRRDWDTGPPSRMDRGSQRVATALSRMQERDGLRSRAGGRSRLVPSASVAHHGRFRGGGGLWRACGRTVPSAAVAGERSSDCWTARSTRQLVRVGRPERASRAALGVSSAAAPRSAQSASGMPTLIAEETKRADLTQLRGARPSLRVRRTHAPPARRPRSRRTRRARQASRRRVAAGAIGLFYARFTTCASRRLFGGAGGVGE